MIAIQFYNGPNNFNIGPSYSNATIDYGVCSINQSTYSDILKSSSESSWKTIATEVIPVMTELANDLKFLEPCVLERDAGACINYIVVKAATDQIFPNEGTGSKGVDPKGGLLNQIRKVEDTLWNFGLLKCFFLKWKECIATTVGSFGLTFTRELLELHVPNSKRKYVVKQTSPKSQESVLS